MKSAGRRQGAGRCSIAVALALCGCGLSPRSIGEEPARALLWPAPPQPPRIRWVQTISRPEDLGWHASWAARLAGWLAGSAQQDRLVRPTGVAAADGMLWVADPGAPALWIYDRAARRMRCAQRAGSARLMSPVAVAAGPARSVFLADSSLGAVLRYDAAGRLLATITAPQMRRPAGAAYDFARDRLYVADSQAHRIWLFTADGRFVGQIGRRGREPGEFNFPTHLAVDAAGRLYVTDALGFRVQWFEPDGVFGGQFGRQGDASGDFASPKGVAVDGHGHLYVVDALFDAVQLFDRTGRLLLSVGQRGSGPGEFWLPNGICIEAGSRIYVADAYNHRLQVLDYLDADPSPAP